MATFTGSTALDIFAGSDTEADIFRFTPLSLQSFDTVSGGAGGFEDVLRFTLAGSINASALANVSGIERIDLADGSNTLILPAALVASAGGTLLVNGGTGTDAIVATALIGTTLRLIVNTGTSGADLISTGDGADIVTLQGLGGGRSITLAGGDDTVNATIATLNGADTISGGAGRDRLVLSGTGTVVATALAGLASIEEIQLPNAVGVALQVSDAMANQADGDVLTVVGNNQDQEIDASAVMAGRGVAFLAGAGNDSFAGGAGVDLVETSGTVSGSLGAGNDALRLLAAGSAASAVSGGTGNDTILLARKGDWVLGAGLTGFETVEMLVRGIRLTLNATEELEVLGSASADHVVLGAARQAFYGFEGDDTVVLTTAMLPGVSLHGGAQTGRDTIILAGGGTIDLRRAFITGFERLEVDTGGAPTTLTLGPQAMDVLLRGAATVTMGAASGQSLFGSNGGDTITLGGTGQVVLARGGDDVIRGSSTTLGVGTMVDGGNGFDRLVLLGTGTVDLRTAALVQNVERIELAGTAQAVLLDAMPALQVQGTAGADTVSALLADLTGSLGSGADVLELAFDAILGFAATSPAGRFSGGDDAATDTLRIVAAGTTNATGQLPDRFDGFEILDLGGIGSFQTLYLAGAAAREVSYGAAPALSVFGGDGNETFTFGTFAGRADGGGGNDTIRANGGADTLTGGTGNDSIEAGGGDDRILGGLGRDTMRGGAGADDFVIQNAAELADWAINPRTIAAAEFSMAPEIDDLLIFS